MNPLDLFFGTGDAVRMIFKLGYVPEESEFYELTCDQYNTTLKFMVILMKNYVMLLLCCLLYLVKIHLIHVTWNHK